MSIPNHSESIVTRSGCRFDVRPVGPGDEAALAAFFLKVTTDDLRFRFLSGIKAVGADRLTAMMQVDHHQTENFIAVIDDGTQIIASAMLACDPWLERGEVAIAVRSDFKHNGVGWEMLTFVAQQAEIMGVKTLESIESRDNHDAIELEREMGFSARSYPGDASLVLLERKLGR